MRQKNSGVTSVLETTGGVLAALSILLHLAGFNFGLILPVMSTSFSMIFLIGNKITRQQVAAFVLLFFVAFLTFAFDLIHDAMFLFIGLAANGIVIAGRTRALSSFLSTSIIVAVTTAVVLIFTEPLNFGVRVSVGEVNPIWQSWLFAFGFIVLFFTNTNRLKGKYILLFLLVIAIFLTGSRQAILAILLAMSAGLITNGLSAKYVFIGLAIGIASTGVIGERFSEGDYSRGLFEDTARLNLYSVAIEEIVRQPLGYGFGNFRYLFWEYPHNLLLELTHSLGVLGLVAFLSIVGYGLYLVVLLPKSLKILILPLFILAITLPQFSGSLTSHRTLYFMMGVALGLSPKRFRNFAQ